jgi:hypothetical protein
MGPQPGQSMRSPLEGWPMWVTVSLDPSKPYLLVRSRNKKHPRLPHKHQTFGRNDGKAGPYTLRMIVWAKQSAPTALHKRGAA